MLVFSPVGQHLAFFLFGRVSGQMFRVLPAWRNSTVGSAIEHTGQKTSGDKKQTVSGEVSEEQFPESRLQSLSGNTRQSAERKLCHTASVRTASLL